MNLRARLHNRRQRRCTHQQNVSVMSAGFERIVCESCGHVSVRLSIEESPKGDLSGFQASAEPEPHPAKEQVSDIS
jgi:hypothetical protein